MLDFSWQTPKEALLIGSPVTLQAQVTVPAGKRLVPAFQERADGAFEILETGFLAPTARIDGQADASAQELTLQITLAVFDLGEQTLPPLDWNLIGDDGIQTPFQSPPLKLTVKAPPRGLRDTGDIRDIKGPFSPKSWPYVLVLLAVLGALAYLWWRKQRPPAPEAPLQPVDTRSPEEIAFADLDSLGGQEMPVKEFYDRLSDILRAYLERRYSIPALSMTTYDLKRAMLNAGLDAEGRSASKSLLGRCDLAKFARMLPTASERRNDIQQTKDIVQKLSPQPDDAAKGDLAGGTAR